MRVPWSSESGSVILRAFHVLVTRQADLLPKTIEAINRTGALEKTHDVANNYIQNAMKSLDHIPPSKYLDSMMYLAEYVQKRKY